MGLMCLRVFSEKNQDLYDELKPYAQRLGAAFQKVNFLRDINADYKMKLFKVDAAKSQQMLIG